MDHFKRLEGVQKTWDLRWITSVGRHVQVVCKSFSPNVKINIKSAVKLDIQKAYDHMNSNLLSYLLNLMDFGDI